MPRICSSVDLPAPDGPMMETNSPGLMSNVMRRSTYSLPAGVSKTFSRSLRPISDTPGGGAVGGALSVEVLGELKPNIRRLDFEVCRIGDLPGAARKYVARNEHLEAKPWLGGAMIGTPEERAGVVASGLPRWSARRDAPR